MPATPREGAYLRDVLFYRRDTALIAKKSCPVKLLGDIANCLLDAPHVAHSFSAPSIGFFSYL
jgi:hypothetical protein